MDSFVSLFVLITVVSLTTSTEATNQIIIRRGYLNSTYASNDFFNYTANYCGNSSYANKWCRGKKAYQVTTSLVAPAIFKWTKCACYCQYDYETFLSREKKCVNISYLAGLNDFGNGVYKFNLQADFTTSSSVVLFPHVRCNGCKVNYAMYFENSQWKQFSFESISITNHCKLSWKISSGELLAGKILKIQFRNCRPNSNQLQLVFLKSKGKYVIDLPTHTVAASTSSSVHFTDTPTSTRSTSSSSYIAAPTPTTSIHQVSTSQVPTTPDLTTSIHQVSEFVTSQISPTKTLMVSTYVCSIGDICSSSSTVADLLPTASTHSPPNLGYETQNSSSSSMWPVIAAVVACIVVGGIVAGLFVWRRRKARARFSDNSGKSPAPDTNNPMYGHNRGDVISLPNRQSQIQKEGGDEEYDYAAVDGGPSIHQKTTTPIYQSLIKENVRDSVYAALNEETPVQYSYNHLQHPQYNPPRSKSDPLYNTLGKPNGDVYMEPGTQITDNKPKASEPLYNVLEGPDGNPGPQDNDPVYNVLEDPDADPHPQDNDPVYNVLENPDADPHPQDNDPVYNVLEDPDDEYDNAPSDDDQNLPASGQDNVAYSSTIDLKMPQTPSSPDYDVLEDPDGALPDSTYQPLGVRVQDDVYQPLDRTSQSIYQSLEPNDSTA